MDCCLAFLDERMFKRGLSGNGPPREGDKVRCGYCMSLMVHRNGAFEWEKE